MKSIILKKATVHMIDFEKKKIHAGSEDISKSCLEYIAERLKKAYSSGKLETLTVGKNHPMIAAMNKMHESDESFFETAKEISRHIYSVESLNEAMPKASVIYVTAEIGGENTLSVMKIDHKSAPVTLVDNNDVTIATRQMLPASKNVDEFIYVTEDSLKLMEKKYARDGNLEAHLNDEWLNGEASLTDQKKMSVMKKVISLYDKNGKTIEHMLEKINDSAACESPVSPSEIVDELLEYNDAEEAKDIMETSGLKETETIDAFKKQDKIKITTDEGISISVPLEVFDQSVDIREKSLKISFEKIKFS